MIPADLWVLSIFVVVAAVMLLIVPLPRPVAGLLWLPTLLVAPGYALVSVIYPRNGSGLCEGLLSEQPATGTSNVTPTSSEHLSPAERAVLSVGMSVVLIPCLAGVIWLAFGTFAADTIVLGVVSFVLVVVIVAATRRGAVSPSEQFAPDVFGLTVAARGWLLRGPRRLTVARTLLVVAVLVAMSSLGYALVVPNDGEAYTTTALLTRQGGDLVVGGYPQTVRVGSTHEFLVQVTNHEGRTTRYTIVATIERVNTGGVASGAATVTEREELGRYHLTVAPDETTRIRSSVTPHLVGESLRLTYYVYRGDAPSTPSSSSAYRQLHHWMTVTPTT